MLQVAFGSETWSLGIHYYLDSFEFQAVGPEELYLVLQAAIDETATENVALNVATIFQSWEHQAGISTMFNALSFC